MNLDGYSRVKRFMVEHPGMTLDEALIYVEKLIDELEVK